MQRLLLQLLSPHYPSFLIDMNIARNTFAEVCVLVDWNCMSRSPRKTDVEVESLNGVHETFLS